MTQQVPLNMVLLRNKIIEGITKLHKNINQSQAVLLIGDTGVGKSTLLSYLIGNQLKIQQIGLKPCLVNSNKTNSINVKIGHDKYSQTSIPVRVKLQDIVIYDCPGFNDNKSSQAQIANSFYYQRLMSLHEKTKIVIVLDEGYITQSRALRFPQLVKKIELAFGTLDTLKNSTLLLVNKCSADSSIADVKKQLSKLISTQGILTSKQTQFFQHLIRNDQIFCFKQPKRSQIGQIISKQQKQYLYSKIKSLDYMDQIDIRNIISNVAKLAIADYLDIIGDQSMKNVNILIDNIKQTIFSCKTGFYQIKEQIIKMMDYKDFMGSNNDFSPFLQFCLKRKIREEELDSFKSDIQVVQFFSKVYSKRKTQSYYLNLITLIMTNLAVILQKVDCMIEDQKIENQRKKRNKQMKKQQKIIKNMEQQNKQNKELNKIIRNAKDQLKSVKNIKKSVRFLELMQNNEVKNSQLPPNTTSQSLVLSFQKKLESAELRVKEISYAIEKLHVNATLFSNSIKF